MEEKKQGTPWVLIFVLLLELVFIVLKVMGQITLSWWMVFSPLWGLVAVFVGLVLIMSVIVGITKALKK